MSQHIRIYKLDPQIELVWGSSSLPKPLLGLQVCGEKMGTSEGVCLGELKENILKNGIGQYLQAQEVSYDDHPWLSPLRYSLLERAGILDKKQVGLVWRGWNWEYFY